MLSALGIYGVLSYVVGRRTQEIGIRMALGATRGDVMRLILGHGMTLTLAGIGIGLAVVVGDHAVALSSLLVGVSPHDPPTFVGIAVLLGRSRSSPAICPAAARRASTL